MTYSFTIWIPLIPLLVFLVIGLSGKWLKAGAAGLLTIMGIAASAILSYQTAYTYFFVSGKSEGVYQKITAYNIEWLRLTDKLHIDLGVLLDPISVMMLVVITTISLMVFIYSWGYMKGEDGFKRFFAFLSLFSFSMIGLVIATNLFQMYMCWELVGLSSYLLIGYYYDKPAAVAASKKAFIVTRFADLGFLIGILWISWLTGTFDFIEITDPQGPAISQGAGIVFLGLSSMTWAVILVFIGGAGKSAMFPLHIWLPDAMEGPTPVSALIHAATMVVAGVFLVARMFPIYAISSPEALEIVAFTGAFTALFAAVIACTQTDIKRVLAFSTMSQIGYMMMALGVSSYGSESGLGFMASMFHLFTHAFFKALLFLGAGSIIHAVHSSELEDMGGLRKYLPITHITFLIACLAIAGIPPFAGFFSKDEILVAAFAANKIYYVIGFLVAGLTAFYMFRLYFSIFWNKEAQGEDLHESPKVMTIPLILLAIGSTFAGFVPFNNLVTSDGLGFNIHMHWNIALPSIGIGLLGIAIAYIFYKKESELPDKTVAVLSGIYRSVHNKFYIDELYIFITKKIIFNLISRPLIWFDRNIVDGFMNALAGATNFVSNSIKEFQSGQLQEYAFVFMSGVILLLLVFLYILY